MAFCGPIAIAALTGLSTAEVERMVLRYRRLCLEPQPRGWLRAVKGMQTGEIVGVLRGPGYHVVEHAWLGDPSSRGVVFPTFASWLRFKGPGLWLVSITGHFVAVNGDWFCDTR